MKDLKTGNVGSAPSAVSPTGSAARLGKFGPAATGWDAYNGWLERTRSPQAQLSRQAVISKALYSVSSYKNWADKAKGAFDPESK
jgi:hypothetical protein